MTLEIAHHAEAMDLLIGITLVVVVLGMLVALGSYVMISFLTLD